MHLRACACLFDRSIGYGDIIPTNRTEYGACAVVMILGGCTWAYIIANICAVVCNVDYTTRNYRETMDQVPACVQMLVGAYVGLCACVCVGWVTGWWWTHSDCNAPKHRDG